MRHINKEDNDGDSQRFVLFIIFGPFIFGSRLEHECLVGIRVMLKQYQLACFVFTIIPSLAGNPATVTKIKCFFLMDSCLRRNDEGGG